MRFAITIDVEMTEEQITAFMRKTGIMFEDAIATEVAQWLTDDLYGKSELSNFTDIVNVETEELTNDDFNS